MKRAEDWLDDWDNETKWTRLSLIEAIQRDALLHAASLLSGMHRDDTINRIRLQYKVFIEAEARKLEP